MQHRLRTFDGSHSVTMNLGGALSFAAAAVLLLLALQSNAYVWRGEHDTSSGYCVGESFGRIPVGGYGYDDEKCEKIFCRQGGVSGHGCSPVQVDAPGCRLESKPGHYPNCCRTHLVCDDENE
ncbi:Toxin-like protein 14 like protein [Argiope bruennichi]|uniref:Toxin-like protein 14 like protein n=1 Tax=Argiope bruennichi TaxID=94029 RepID=A0A8T0FTD1_ARGBR|nr:Toxin-like protein 14 like protein [Argiope bruennichi]